MTDDTTEKTPDPASSLNSQINESLAALQAAVQSGAGDHVAAMAELARVHATALKDFQAVARQQSDATIMSATATAAVAKMMGAPYATGGLGAGVLALAEAQGVAAITMLKNMRGAAGDDDAATAALDRLRAAAAAEVPVAPAPSDH